jgi:uncharacterized membrane protein
MEEGGLTIQWTQMPTYNTIMAIATGAALCSIARIGKLLYQGKSFSPEGNAMNFGILGLILLITGTHMSIAWPLAKYFPFDNIIFGEPSFALGAILSFTSLFFFIRSRELKTDDTVARYIGSTGAALKYFFYALGLSLISIAVAGMYFQLFVAPPEEPIAGAFADQPWIEATFISGLYFFTGIAILLMPFNLNHLSNWNLNDRPKGLQKFSYLLLTALGWVFILFGAMNYFTHIGLIINTMPQQGG